MVELMDKYVTEDRPAGWQLVNGKDSTGCGEWTEQS